MNLFFAPLACSLATRIALYEADADAEFTQVNTTTKKVSDGTDFLAVAPMGQVPALRIADGSVLTEHTAVLQYVADTYPGAQLVPARREARAKLQQWLGFIGTELHKAVFVPLLDRTAPDAVMEYARDKAPQRLGVLDRHLTGRQFLLDEFTVADAYLTTVLNWAAFTGIDLGRWGAVQTYFKRMCERPTIARALREEMALYQESLRSAKP